MKKYKILTFLFIFFLIIPKVNAYTKKEALNETIKFDYRYAYNILNSNEQTEYINLINFDKYFITNKESKIIYRDLSRYNDVDMILFTFKEQLRKNTTIKITCINDDKYTSSISVSKGINNVYMVIPRSAYNTIEINISSDEEEIYLIDKIELLSHDGNSYTNQDVGIYVFPEDIDIPYYSFDNGSNYILSNVMYFSNNTEGKIVIKNSCWFKSLPKDFKITGIDKEKPNCSIKVTGKNSKKEIKKEDWINEGLNYSFNLLSSGFSKADIYYCQDTNNTCIPETKYNNKEITKYNIINGEYYIRYRAVSNSKAMSKIYSYKAKVDSKPSEVVVKAYSNGKQIENNRWVNNNVTFEFEKIKGPSKTKIYYCKDIDNTCIPDTLIEENTIVDTYKYSRGIYYIRYYSINETNYKSDINTFIIKVDDSKYYCESKKSVN